MADYYDEDTQALRGLHTPARNNYFYGKLLDVQHFTMEQRYFNNKRWLLNRLVLGSGVVCGLDLQATGASLTLGPGLALDPLGREIVVPAPVTIDPTQGTDVRGNPTGRVGGEVAIYLAFAPAAAELVPALVGDAATRGEAAPSTIRESYAVVVRAAPSPVPPPPPDLAQLFTPDPGQPRVTLDAVLARLQRQGAGACADAGDEPLVLLGQATLSADGRTVQAVRYTTRQVVLNNTLLFELLLALWERVEQVAATPPPAPPPSEPPPEPPPSEPPPEPPPSEPPPEPPPSEPPPSEPPPSEPPPGQPLQMDLPPLPSPPPEPPPERGLDAGGDQPAAAPRRARTPRRTQK